MGKYLTTQEVADLLRTPAETLRYWRHVGKGPKSFKLGRRVLYDETHVIAFIEAAQAGDARSVRIDARELDDALRPIPAVGGGSQ